MRLPVVLLSCLVNLYATLAIEVDWEKVQVLRTLPKDLKQDVGFRSAARTTDTNEVKQNIPHHAAIVIYHDEEQSMCSGALISQQLILTAAHCFMKDMKGASIFLGVVRPMDRTPGRLQLDVAPSSIIKHNNHDPITYINDIAIIKLPLEVKQSASISPIALPLPESVNETYDNQPAEASGWGRRNSKKPIITLRNVESKIQSLAECESILHHGMENSICLDGKSKNPGCVGDSGGPLVLCDSTGAKILVGIASYVADYNCTADLPTVFTRISSFLDWIKDNSVIESQ